MNLPFLAVASSKLKQAQSRWLSKRVPAKKEQTLDMGNIFIFPSLFGWAYIGFIALLFLLGTNYQNNLVLLLSYLMASLFITAIFQSFVNLLGISARAIDGARGYVGEPVSLNIIFTTPQPKYSINIFFPGQQKSRINKLEKGTRNEATVQFLLAKRGFCKLERVTVESYFAFGLLRTWAKLDFDWRVLAIPKPKSYSIKQPFARSGSDRQVRESNNRGSDDFYQLKDYQRGEPLSHVSWKHVARGAGMLTKEYSAETGDTIWVSLAKVENVSMEDRLRILVFCVQEFAQSRQAFGLDLGNFQIQPDNTEQHLANCLEAIACYGH